MHVLFKAVATDLDEKYYKYPCALYNCMAMAAWNLCQPDCTIHHLPSYVYAATLCLYLFFSDCLRSIIHLLLVSYVCSLCVGAKNCYDEQYLLPFCIKI